MRLDEDLDFTTLGWVKSELDETLRQARLSLEAFVQDQADTSQMRFCATYLHQVHGTLRMVELYGAAMVAEEMEQLAKSLLDAAVPDRNAAFAVLMRGMMQLPDYLERLQGGHRDVPLVLLPLLNELRGCRGEAQIGETALFMPDLNAELPSFVPGLTAAPAPAAQQRALAVLRTQLQLPLLAWIRNQGDAARHLATMRGVLDGISAQCYSLPGRRLWWIAGGVAEGLERGLLDEHSVEVRKLIGKVDRNVRALIEEGETALARGESEELARSLLYYVAHARPGSERLAAIYDTYRLDRLLPSQREIAHAEGALAGHNRMLLDTVARAIKEDLLRVKDALDLYLRNVEHDPRQLAGEADALARVADTLGMLGLNVPRRVVHEQRETVAQLAAGARTVDEATLLDVAGALLYVESSLDDHIDRLGAESGEDAGLQLPKAEARRLLDIVLKEASANLARVKDDLVAFIESPWVHARVAAVPALLDELVGALRMLDVPRLPALVEAIGRFVHNELVADRRVPTAEQMDLLADALASVEYFLEAVREQRPQRERILDVTQRSLAALGYWPAPALRAMPAETEDTHVASHGAHSLSEAVSVVSGSGVDDLLIGSATAVPTPSQDLAGLRFASTEPTAPPQAELPEPGEGLGEWVEITEEIEEAVPADATPLAGFRQDGEAADAEIREVFIEEVGEEIQALNSGLDAWLSNPDDLDTLRNMRRAFHTLKGSGRLVGAMELGEFAWKVENLLNRVLDRSVPPGPMVQALVRHAIAALPAVQSSLQGAQAWAPLPAIMQAADRLSSGEAAQLDDFAQAAPSVQRRSVTRRVWQPHPQPMLAPESEVSTEPAAALAPIAISTPLLPPIDAVLLEILRSETAQHLDIIQAWLAAPGDRGVSEPLLRAVHTLNGAIAMVDIPVIGHVLAPLETYLKRLRGSAEPMPADGREALGEAAALITQIMAEYDRERPEVPDSDALAARLAELRDALPEPEHAGAIYGVGVHADDAHEVERAEAERVEAARIEAERVESARAEAARVEAEHIEAERRETERLAAERAEIERAEAARFAAERVEAERSAVAQFEAERAEIERLEAERREAEHAQATRAAADQAVETWLADLTRQSPEPDIEAPPAAPDVGALADDPLTRLLLQDLQAASTESSAGVPQEVLSDAEQREPSDAVQAEFTPLSDLDSRDADARDAEAYDAVPAFEQLYPQHEPALAASARLPEAPIPAFPDDAQPDGHLALAESDPDLLEVFVQEGLEILDQADARLNAWRAQPDVHDAVIGLQRDLHTLKGGARMAGIVPVGDLAHAMESLLDAVAAGRRLGDTAVVASLERGFDRLHELVERVRQGHAVALPVNAIALFERLAEVGAASAPRVVAAEPAVVPVPAEVARVPLQPLPPIEAEDLVRATQEMVRVRSDVLDALVNQAGEVSIYRSRLEQQVSTFRFNLVELDQTVARLRDQLRKLEIETEAQIIARFQREQQIAAHDSGFDPLELDRFSQLQQYSRALAESVSDLASLQGLLDDTTRQSETLLLQQSRVSSELQEGLMRTRMVPFEALVPSLRRTLRQAAQDLSRRAQLRVEGAHGEMDRTLLERMKAPFEHMLRNAVAHGVESAAERAATGKPEEGTVTIRVSREATEVLLDVSDDGRGLDRDAIRGKAIERGLLRADAELSDRDLYAFILESGFSTAGEITQIAGRGVGMDVVASEIKQLGGSLAIDSVRGQGTRFQIRLPFTLAVTQAILIKQGESVFAVPMTSVQGMARITREDLAARMLDAAPMYTYAGERYVIHELGRLLGVGTRHSDDPQLPLLLIRSGELRAAVHVDQVVGSREIVVKSVGPQISSVPGLFGATIMGDGSVVIILDLPPLVRRGTALGQYADAVVQAAAEGGDAERPIAPIGVSDAAPRARPLVMVVDDSITMRKVTSRVLERVEMDVITAKDGVDALERLQERTPDVMLLDIEMPRMDGYELATHMKNDPRLKRVPIIMITSRSGEKHRQRALEIGVERYLGKPYQEADLLRNVQEVLGGQHA
ncbi:Hpt domain-containing protein [Metallibacterium sp.]|uniref:Hpt domain-containing protein n=1 Tax=Metallibacterium sp. TaxID=2940281 RepID=UPI002602B68A|nr:Hpt domain-containing protein [Metallibacterium sp.]